LMHFPLGKVPLMHYYVCTSAEHEKVLAKYVEWRLKLHSIRPNTKEAPLFLTFHGARITKVTESIRSLMAKFQIPLWPKWSCTMTRHAGAKPRNTFASKF
uniref:CRAL-TRIO domain-containing protein n=1 Tax=Anisakis simplex TaxID=6269 RepID=A0A0M3KKG2_ANISI